MPKHKTEFELIEWIRRQRQHAGRTRIGIGDDCAALDFRPGETCLVTTDALVDGVHFDLANTKPELVGRKAIAVSVSDIAAMAGRPVAAVVAAAFPHDAPARLPDRLCKGLAAACDEFGVDLVGGDVVGTPGPLTITSTVIGAVKKGREVRRSGAKLGDAILVTGELGGSILGKHLTFTPRVREARSLARRFKIHAMIDLSDGLSRDLGHILDESGGFAAQLDAAAIPCSQAAAKLARRLGRPALWHALNDGEDFELLFTASQAQAACIVKRWRGAPPVTIVGDVVKGRGIWLRHADGHREQVAVEGFEHLTP